MNIEMTPLQWQFHEARQDEVCYGGAAGGGKSYGQILDAFLYALKYPGIKQLILRRTFRELERSIIRESLGVYPKGIAAYNDGKKMWTFKNGSIIDFGYCDSENDVFNYQSAEYDIIRFDEATHFTEFMYAYLKSRCRGANDYPKQVKITTNPGGVGHSYFKGRFIDNGIDEYKDEDGTRIFIPAMLKDNPFLTQKDPNYVKRLRSLPDKERKALEYGDWNITDGMYFGEFRRDIHVIDPFEIPDGWIRYRTLDYGLDMLACYWITIDTQGNEYCYKELYENNLIISEACRRIKEVNGDDEIKCTYAPPDLWARKSNTGESSEETFYNNGIALTKSDNARIQGWYSLKEHIRPYSSRDEQTGASMTVAKLRFFSNCKNIARTLPLLQMDNKNPNDVANEPHELTHGPDAIRGFCIERTKASILKTPEQIESDRVNKKKYQDRVRAIAGSSATRSFINYGG